MYVFFKNGANKKITLLAPVVVFNADLGQRAKVAALVLERVAATVIIYIYNKCK